MLKFAIMVACLLCTLPDSIAQDNIAEEQVKLAENFRKNSQAGSALSHYEKAAYLLNKLEILKD